MNTPEPNETPHPVAKTAQRSLPTVGSLFGSAAGAYIASAMHITDPMELAAIVSVTTAVVTALSHFLGERIGVTFT